GALARWQSLLSASQLFQQFVSGRGKPLKRLNIPLSLLHRAKAPVLMRTSPPPTQLKLGVNEICLERVLYRGFLAALVVFACCVSQVPAVAATLTAQNVKLGTTPALLGYNSGHFVPGSNT